jgi:hypothetical protein
MLGCSDSGDRNINIVFVGFDVICPVTDMSKQLAECIFTVEEYVFYAALSSKKSVNVCHVTRPSNPTYTKHCNSE